MEVEVDRLGSEGRICKGERGADMEGMKGRIWKHPPLP